MHSDNLIVKLNQFTWNSDEPQMWFRYKFALKITACCLLVSLLVIIYIAITDSRGTLDSLIYLGVAHLFVGLITMLMLGQVCFFWEMLKKVAPESDVHIGIEKVKRECVIYGLGVWAIVITIGVAISLSFAFFSGVVLALSGLVYSFVFAHKAGELFPSEFIYMLRMKVFHEKNQKTVNMNVGDQASSNQSLGFNPATGLPMVSGMLDSAGNPYGSVILQQSGTHGDVAQNIMSMDKIITQRNTFPHIDTSRFNPASGLPMMNDSFDINGNVFGTTSHFYDHQHHWYHHYHWNNYQSHDYHRWDNR